MMYGTSAYQIPYAPAPGLFAVGIYCRLSKDDDLQGESASISNQRELLTSVCKAQGWNIVEVYQEMKTPSLIQFNDLRRLAGRGGKLRGQGG